MFGHVFTTVDSMPSSSVFEANLQELIMAHGIAAVMTLLDEPCLEGLDLSDM